jgi:pimeloyl-ACP methyl ester carboxylesterase
VTFSARGYPPSEVPTDPARYGQDIVRRDVVAIMDALGIAKAHVVGHSMGAYTALHVGIHHADRCISVTAAGCGWGSVADPAAREAMRKEAAANAALFTENSIAEAAAIYANGPARQAHKNKDPRGFAEFARMLSEHSATGHALTMAMLQAKRPTLWDLEAELKRFSVPLLVVVGDEDDACLDGSVFLKRTVPTAGLLVLPRCGHTVTSEEPAAFNAALADFFPAAESGRWLAHKGK